MRNRNNKFQNVVRKSRQCSCGGESKLITRKNYPYGRNSKVRISTTYICRNCKQLNLN